MAYSSVTIKKNTIRQDGLARVLSGNQEELERTSEAGSGPVAVAVSDYMAGGVAANAATPSPVSASSQTTNQGGGGSPSPLLDYYVISRRSRKPALGQNGKNLDKNRRVRRFYQRYFTGVGVGGRLRILTLTSSDEAVNESYDIHQHFEALKKRLRRRWGVFEYMGVREIKGDRSHLHLVFRGEYMAQVQLSAMWQSLHRSKVVDIRAVWSKRGGARYLAKYLAKEAINRYWASYNWVFSGWVGWSRRVKRACGNFPSRTLLRSLARQDKVKRRLAMDFLEWRYRSLWEWSVMNENVIPDFVGK